MDEENKLIPEEQQSWQPLLPGELAQAAQAANEAAGLARTPEGYTWHHHQDGKTMLLVPSNLHGAVRHTGGVSTIRHGHSQG